MARCLIIGCGCRGRALGHELLAAGHAVRGTTRDPARASELASAGIEAVVGDPDRVATLAAALEHVAVACILLGSATGTPESIRALHTTRLEMLLSRMLDSTVRGVVYAAAGTVDAVTLRGGADRVLAVCEDSRIPYVLLDADPGAFDDWLLAARAAVLDLLE